MTRIQSTSVRRGLVRATTPGSGLEPLRRFLGSFGPIPDSEWDFVAPHIGARSFKRREHLQRAGNDVAQLYFVLDGLVRVYLLAADGVEHTTALLFGGDLAGDYNAGVVRRQSSVLNVEAVRATRVLVFTPALLATLYRRDPCWDRIARGISEYTNVRRDEKELCHRLYSPEEHYQYLLRTRPHFVSDVPLHHLASYMGIRPETLSRIRRRAHAAISIAISKP